MIQPSALVALSLDVAKSQLPAHTTVLVYDVSEAVLGKEPTYVDRGDDGAWFVLAACTTDGKPVQENGPNLAMAIVPKDEVTKEIRAKSRKHDYNDLSVECKQSSNSP
ncbi:hypothetical protein [Leifsonia xyli]|uniref:hypothetical protein n=1 Tax=Leifsonia xyli TaxID=1575 RepID=UPI003D673FF3